MMLRKIVINNASKVVTTNPYSGRAQPRVLAYQAPVDDKPGLLAVHFPGETRYVDRVVGSAYGSARVEVLKAVRARVLYDETIEIDFDSKPLLQWEARKASTKKS